MAFFPDVQRGEPFKPSSALSNNVRHMVNAMNGFKSFCGKNFFPGSNRIQVYNASASTISAGTAVAFSTDALCGDAIPCVPMTTSVPVWGVLSKSLAAREMGDCIITGFARVVISGGSGELAKPDTSNPAQFLRCESGGVPILYSTQDMVIVNVGFGGGEGANSSVINYLGDFTVRYLGNLQFEVYQGENPTSDYAGYSDCGYFPKTTVTINSSGGYIYAKLRYDSNSKTYTRTIVFSNSVISGGSGIQAEILLATVGNDGSIVQNWRKGSIYFSERWWI